MTLLTLVPQLSAKNSRILFHKYDKQLTRCYLVPSTTNYARAAMISKHGGQNSWNTENVEVRLNRRGRQFSRLLAAEVCASAIVMLDTPCSEVVWRVLTTHSIRQFPLHFPSRASPCAITFQLESTQNCQWSKRLTLAQPGDLAGSTNWKMQINMTSPGRLHKLATLHVCNISIATQLVPVPLRRVFYYPWQYSAVNTNALSTFPPKLPISEGACIL